MKFTCIFADNLLLGGELFAWLSRTIFLGNASWGPLAHDLVESWYLQWLGLAQGL